MCRCLHLIFRDDDRFAEPTEIQFTHHVVSAAGLDHGDGANHTNIRLPDVVLAEAVGELLDPDGGRCLSLTHIIALVTVPETGVILAIAVVAAIAVATVAGVFVIDVVAGQAVQHVQEVDRPAGG